MLFTQGNKFTHHANLLLEKRLGTWTGLKTCISIAIKYSIIDQQLKMLMDDAQGNTSILVISNIMPRSHDEFNSHQT